MPKEEPHWVGNPRKLDRFQRKDQSEKWEEGEKAFKLGIRGGFTEMAHPGDSIERIAKRAYETAKNYPTEKAKAHAGMVSRVLKSAYPELGDVRLKKGDQLKITEKEIILTTMDRFGAHKDYRVGIGSPEIKQTEREAVQTDTRTQLSALREALPKKPTPFLDAIQNASSKVDGTAYAWEKVKTSTANVEAYMLTLITGKRIIVVASEEPPKYRAVDVDERKKIVLGTDNFDDFFSVIKNQMIAARDDTGENLERYNS